MRTEEFECDCCGIILTKEQQRIEKQINTEFSPCYCDLIIKIDKKNKQIKKLKNKLNDALNTIEETNGN